MIMKAENSHDLLGKFRVSLEEGLRTRDAGDINTSLRAGENKVRCPSSISEIWGGGGRDEFLLLKAFCSSQSLNRLDASHPLWGR